jgi:hypothetical protein
MLRLLFHVVFGVALVVWAGSLVHQLATVMWLFGSLPRDEAGKVAAMLFGKTETMLLVAAPVACVAAIFCRPRWIAISLVIALLLLIVQASLITPAIDAMRQQSPRPPAFRTYHNVSNALYLLQLLIVLQACVLDRLWPWRGRAGTFTAHEIQRSTDGPV